MHDQSYYDDIKFKRRELFNELEERSDCHREKDQVYKIRQSDFDNGPLYINKPGIWKLKEDIVLNFNESNDFFPR